MSTPCKKCGAPIIFRRHLRTKKLCPIDDRPSPEGTLRLASDGEHYVISQADIASLEPRGVLSGGYTNHWTTCTATRRPGRLRMVPMEG